MMPVYKLPMLNSMQWFLEHNAPVSQDQTRRENKPSWLLNNWRLPRLLYTSHCRYATPDSPSQTHDRRLGPPRERSVLISNPCDSIVRATDKKL